MKSREAVRLFEIKKELQNFVVASGVRDTFHEPDEQDVTAKVTGVIFDNAFGSHQDFLEDSQQEIIVHLCKNDKKIISVNLADLLALAAQ